MIRTTALVLLVASLLTSCRTAPTGVTPTPDAAIEREVEAAFSQP